MRRGEKLWEPPPDARAASQMGSFLDWLDRERGLRFSTYHELWTWSIADHDAFWTAVSTWAGVRWRRPPDRMLTEAGAMRDAGWFPGAVVNYAENALANNRDPADVAVIEVSQTRPRQEVTWDQLRDAVGRCRAGLQRLGVEQGDRVAAYAPNIVETLVGFLASASLGAVWSSCAPEFGERAVVDRFSQIEPKLLLVVDGYQYGDKAVRRRDAVDAIRSRLPSVEHVVTIPYLDHGSDREDGWAALTAEASPLEFADVPADHPLYVLFSSGTTGLPKPIVHAHGGIVLEHVKALALHHDLGPSSRFSWFTTTGWMMWNYLLSGLLVDASIVLFDGDPTHPDLSTLWKLAADEAIDALGVSAPFLMACAKAGLNPGSALDLGRLRQVGSTGSPLPAEGFRWVRDSIGEHVQVASLSGGTDICSGFVGPSPLVPVRAGEISCRMLGCSVTAVRPDGSPCDPGELGELVLEDPIPSMPIALWGDADGERLRRSYFTRFPGKWHHGDWIKIFDDGACVITGRSDATLNRGGVRLGTSDFYAVVEADPAVSDSLVVHLDAGDGVGHLVLFVVPSREGGVDDEVRHRLGVALRRELSPRHLPDVIVAAPSVPRTLSGKKLELPVKRMLMGEPSKDVAAAEALADPGSLAWYEAYAAAAASSGTR